MEMETLMHLKNPVRTGTLAALAAGALLLTACSDSGGTPSGEPGSNDESTHTLSVASFLLDATPNADMVHWFLDTVTENSNGRIAFDYFAAESLCPGAEIVQCISDGRADMGVTVPTYTPDKFPLQNLSALPFMTDDNQAMMAAFHELQKTNAEFAAESERLGLRNLGYWSAGTSIFGSKEPLASAADLNGVRIRAVGDGLLSALDAAGASPVALTAGEMYEGVERGIIDAVANNLDAPISYKLTEVLDHWTDTGYGHYITIGMWISDSAYDALPSDLQAVIDDAVVALNDGRGIAQFATTAATQCDYMLEQPNVELVRWSDAEIEAFKTLTGDSAKQAWVKMASDAGVADAAGVLAQYESLLQELGADESSRVAPLADCAARFLDR